MTLIRVTLIAEGEGADQGIVVNTDHIVTAILIGKNHTAVALSDGRTLAVRELPAELCGFEASTRRLWRLRV
jgi:hypothetical protein